jgi:2-oxo-4-hydroxy-4-carboxy-5-ureidoimidazoline decarboxylase
MLEHRPFGSTEQLYQLAAREWQACNEDDYLEAFNHHPRIGEDMAALRQRFGKAAGLSSQEQAGVAGATEETLLALREANAAYLERYGFIFIICASGKSAGEMLRALRQRLDNDPHTELGIAAEELAQITRLRLTGLGT